MGSDGIAIAIASVALVIAIAALWRSGRRPATGHAVPLKNEPDDMPLRVEPGQIRPLVDRLDARSRRGLESAAGNAARHGHARVEIEHWLLALLQDRVGDLEAALREADIQAGDLLAELRTQVARFPNGHAEVPELATALVNLLLQAAEVATAEFGDDHVQPSHILYGLLTDPELRDRIGRKVPSLVAGDRLAVALTNSRPRPATDGTSPHGPGATANGEA